MKRLIGLLAILLLLALGAYFIERPRIEESRKIAEGKTDAVKLFPELTKDTISKIVLRDGLTEKTLRKSDAGWEVSGDGVKFWKSDQSKIDEALKNITEELSEETLVTSNSSKHGMFEVTAELGIEVEVYAGGDSPAAKFFVGKQGPDFISTYIRKDGEDRVFSIPIQIGTIYGRELTGWRDKFVMRFEPGQVAEALFDFPEGKYRVKKEVDGTWMLLEPEAAKANGVKIEAELSAFSQLEAVSFEDKTLEEAGLAEPESEVRVKLSDGKEIALYISAESEGYVNGYVEGNPEVIFKIAMSNLSPLKITSISQLKMAEETGEADSGELDMEESSANE